MSATVSWGDCNLGLLAVTALLPLGCGDFAAIRPKKLTGPAWTEEQWPKLLRDLKGKLGENPRLLRVQAERHFATFEAQDPKKPEQGAIQIKITVHGARKMGGLYASASGEVKEVRTYQGPERGEALASPPASPGAREAQESSSRWAAELCDLSGGA